MILLRAMPVMELRMFGSPALPETRAGTVPLAVENATDGQDLELSHGRVPDDACRVRGVSTLCARGVIPTLRVRPLGDRSLDNEAERQGPFDEAAWHLLVRPLLRILKIPFSEAGEEEEFQPAAN